MNTNDLVQVLKEKAIEESYELYWSKNEISVREELADLYEVIRALAKLYGISISMIETAASKKRKAKGGFKDGMYLLQTLEIPIKSDKDERVLIDANQLGFIREPRNIPEFKKNTLLIPITPTSEQPHRIKLPKRITQFKESSIFLDIRYEETKIRIDFIIASKAKQTSDEPMFPDL